MNGLVEDLDGGGGGFADLASAVEDNSVGLVRHELDLVLVGLEGEVDFGPFEDGFRRLGVRGLYAVFGCYGGRVFGEPRAVHRVESHYIRSPGWDSLGLAGGVCGGGS